MCHVFPCSSLWQIEKSLSRIFSTPVKEIEKDVKLDILSSKKELAANRQDLPVVASQGRKTEVYT